MQVEVDMKCMETNFGGHGLSGFRDFALFRLPSKVDKFPFQIMDYIVHGVKYVTMYMYNAFIDLLGVQIVISLYCRYCQF